MIICNKKIGNKKLDFNNNVYINTDEKEFKFFLDSCQFYQAENFFYLNGMITNRFDRIGSNSMKDYFNNFGFDRRMVESFEGTFHAIHISQEQIQCITDHFASKPLFYYFKEDLFVLSDNIYKLNSFLKDIRDCKYDEQSIYEMLTYGFMLDNNTLIKDIKILPKGTTTTFNFESKDLTYETYHQFDYEKAKKSNLKDDLFNVNKLFEAAVKKLFDKDIEHCYKHFSTISGGLDARLVNSTALNLGYKNITNFSIGQSSSLDIKFANKLVDKFQNSKFIVHLDSGESILKYEDVVRNNFGLVLYSGQSHMYYALSKINFEQFGVIHTGQLGDVIFSNFAEGEEKNIHLGYHSNKLLKKLNSVKYDNPEKFLFETRGFNAVIRSHLALKNFSEYWSPFLDINLLNYANKMSNNYKKNHKFYRLYYKRFHKEIGKTGSDRYYGTSIFSSKLIKFLFKIRYLGLTFLFKYVLFKLKIISELPYNHSDKSMNPFELWFEKDDSLLANFILHYNNFVDLCKKNRTLNEGILNDIDDLFTNGNVTEKTQVLTVLQFISESQLR